MNEKRFSIFNIFLFCLVFGLFFFCKIDSFAERPLSIEFYGGGQTNLYYSKYDITFGNPEARYAILIFDDINQGVYDYGARFYSNSNSLLSANVYSYGFNWNTDERDPQYDMTSTSNYFGSSSYQVAEGIFAASRYNSNTYSFLSRTPFATNIPTFTNYESMLAYLSDGSVAFDNSLILDDFYVWNYGVLDTNVDTVLSSYNSVFKVSWSNPDITNVRVRIDGTDLMQDYVSQTSPYIDYFNAGNFAHVNGETVSLTATPYGVNGSYGVSLYCTLKYDGNGLITNIYRKFVNTDKQINTVDIPYNGVEKTYEVDGVTTNNTYKVYYNPTTNEYGDLNLYEIYYSPVIVYPYGTPSEEVEETQDVVNNSYVTNNYYETTKNINLDFDFNFDDISNNDIQDTYHGVGTFFDGFGGLIGKIVELLIAVFPFLSPGVAATIIFAFGLMVTLAIIALILKIVGVIADIIPF